MSEAKWTVGMAVRDQGSLSGPYKLLMRVCPPAQKRRRDLDNLIKAVSDALVKGGLVGDDSLAQEITMRWEVLDEPGLIVEVEPCQSLMPSEPERSSATAERSTGEPSGGSSLTVLEYRRLMRRGPGRR